MAKLAPVAALLTILRPKRRNSRTRAFTAPLSNRVETPAALNKMMAKLIGIRYDTKSQT